MRTILFGFFSVLTVTTSLACSASVTNNGGDGGSNSGDGSASGDGSTMNNSDGGGNGGPITFPATCPASPCGGSVVGTWDYTDGCIADPFKDLKTSCPSLQVMNQTGTVKGTVTFTSSQVMRSGTASYTATLVIPIECTQGAPCSSFDQPGAVCTGSGACNCTVSKTESIVDGDTYTIQGTTVVTGSGNEYDYCVQGSKLTYTEGGNNPQHAGVFSLAKR